MRSTLLSESNDSVRFESLTKSFRTFANHQEIEVASQNPLGVVDQPLVHQLGPLQLVQLLHEGVVAEDRPRQPQRVRSLRAHVLDHLVLQLLEDEVEVATLLGVGVQLVVLDGDLALVALFG